MGPNQSDWRPHGKEEFGPRERHRPPQTPRGCRVLCRPSSLGLCCVLGWKALPPTWQLPSLLRDLGPAPAPPGNSHPSFRTSSQHLLRRPPRQKHQLGPWRKSQAGFPNSQSSPSWRTEPVLHSFVGPQNLAHSQTRDVCSSSSCGLSPRSALSGRLTLMMPTHSHQAGSHTSHLLRQHCDVANVLSL